MSTSKNDHFHAMTRYFAKGSWAIADQVLYAGSNFVVSILVARWIGPTDYGAFALALSVLYLIGNLHGAVLAEPMVVFGSGKYQNRLPAYLGTVLWGHLVLSSGIALVLLVVSFSFRLVGSSTIASGILGIAMAVPSLLLLWTARRACYITMNPRLAASGGLFYLATTSLGLILLQELGRLNGISAFALMSLSGLIAGGWLVWRLGVRSIPTRWDPLSAQALGDHWRYGRWSAATAMLMFIPANVYLFVLPFWGGLASTGALKALLNLLTPILNLISAGSQLAIPTMVRLRDSPARMRRFLILGLALFLAGGLINYILLGYFAEPVIRLLYGNQYVEYSDLLWVLGLLPISAAFVALFGSALRAMELPGKVFVAYVGSTILALSLGVTLVARFGLAGAGIGTVLTSATTALGLATLYARLSRNRSVSA